MLKLKLSLNFGASIKVIRCKKKEKKGKIDRNLTVLNSVDSVKISTKWLKSWIYCLNYLLTYPTSKAENSRRAIKRSQEKLRESQKQ